MAIYINKYKCQSKRIGKTKFKYVSLHEYKGIQFYFAHVLGLGYKSFTINELREAAKWVDIQLIENGKKPVNILKRKQ